MIISDQLRHKIGITGKTVDSRLKHQEYRLLQSLSGRLIDCFNRRATNTRANEGQERPDAFE